MSLEFGQLCHRAADRRMEKRRRRCVHIAPNAYALEIPKVGKQRKVVRRSKTVVIIIEEEEPEEVEPPCPSTRKSRIGRRIRNLFRSSSNQLPVDGTIENLKIENHDDIDEDLEVRREKQNKRQQYEIHLVKYQKNLAFYKNKIAIYQRKVNEFELFKNTFHSLLVTYKNEIDQLQNKINKCEKLVLEYHGKLTAIKEVKALKIEARARAKRQRAAIRAREARAPMRLRAHIFLSNAQSSSVVNFLLRVLTGCYKHHCKV